MSTLLTVPNALTLLRGLGIPLFIYLALSLHADGAAIIVLIIGGATDYFDGKLARAWNQESRFGELMDPAIDRLYIGATLIVLFIRDAIPLWIIGLLVGRDLILAIMSLMMNRLNIPPFKVTFLGKAATFNLMYSFPLLLLAKSSTDWGDVAFVAGWSFAVWGIGLYLVTGLDYFRTGWRCIAHAK
ncbi:MAG TPA: CDP-alcohol phosphatidyltransferase family protein [Candidatus Paceibacterota bacterium]|nr:CDP-alcohol phosphatidyltransferase family protein [Candidatus Paceibacterota bacterium]